MTNEIEKKVEEEMNDDLIPGETEKREAKNSFQPKTYTGNYNYNKPYSAPSSKGRNYGYGHDDGFDDDGYGTDDLFDKPYSAPSYSAPPRLLVTGFQKKCQENYDKIDAVFEKMPPKAKGTDENGVATATVETVFVETVSLAIVDTIFDLLDAANVIVKTQSMNDLKLYMREFLTKDCWIADKSGKWYKNVEEKA